MENNIEKIILAKEYEALNTAELAAISEHISSAEEYAQIRELLSNLKSKDEEFLMPDPSVKATLISKFQSSSVLRVVKSSGRKSKSNRIIYNRLSYAALIVAGLIIAFLLIKDSGKKENLTANKTTLKEQNILNNRKGRDTVPTQEKQIPPVIHDNNTPLFTINKQAIITQKDTTNQTQIAALTNNKTQNQNEKKGRTLDEDLAVMDVMYVAL